MSDSDENAFASADEGEEKEATQKATLKQGPAKQEKTTTKAASVVGGADKETKGSEKPVPSSSSKDEGSRGKGKQQQRNKKGKGSGAASKQEPKVSEPKKPMEITKKAEGKVDVKKNSSEMQGKSETAENSLKASGDGVAKTQDKEAKEKPEKDLAKDSGDRLGEKEGAKISEDGPLGKSSQSVVKSPEAQSIAASDRDHHTPQQGQILNRLEETASSGSGWGWSSWGSSLLSAASTSVQTFTHQVGDGLTTIMDTVESSLGVPDPHTLAEADVKEQEKPVTDQPEEEVNKKLPDTGQSSPEKHESQDRSQDRGTNKQTSNVISSSQETSDNKGGNSDSSSSAGSAGSGWFSTWGVGDLAKKVQDTGKSLAAKGQTLMTEGFDAVEHLAAGGIDVLENIGKKTYNTLAEHDPALRRTRQFLTPRINKPNLSSVLREAKEQAEKRQQQEEATQEALKADFGTLFDDNQGIAHLEALEILSNQSEKKVHSLLNSLAADDLATIKPQLIDIKNAFQLDEDSVEDTGDQDFPNLVQQHLSELELGTAPDKLNKVHQMVQAWIQDFDSDDSNNSQNIKGTHEKSIQSLAELTAKGVEQFHKAGELVLLDKDKDKDCKERAHSLARLTGVLCHEIGNLSNKFVACLNKLAEEDKSQEVTGMITNIYLEASNSSTYIQDAFQLLLPVLQHAALEQAILARTS